MTTTDPDGSSDLPIKGHVMTDEETDRMRIASWWASFTYRDRPTDDAAATAGTEG